MKEQVIPTLILFPELAPEIKKILAEKQRAVVFNKGNNARKIIPRYGDQTMHMDVIMIMCLSQAWNEARKERSAENAEWVKKRIK